MNDGSHVLVCGGAGFIGSHTLRALMEAGYSPIVLDDLSSGHREAVPASVPLVVGSLADAEVLNRIFSSARIRAVIHFAAFIEAGESMLSPARFYQNNVANTLVLLETMRKHNVTQLVFSSSAGVYGEPQRLPIQESDPKLPVNVYGETKWMVEQMLQAFSRAYGLRSVSLRYFNACGAWPDGSIGEAHRTKSHLIELALLTALGKRSQLKVFGTDYPTPDGTAIRDYVHVIDLASAHVMALRALEQGLSTSAFNVGAGKGFSVKEVLDTVEEVTGVSLNRALEPRRTGDPAVLVADGSLIHKVLGWVPKHTTLKGMIEDAWRWHRTHPDGFESRQLEVSQRATLGFLRTFLRPPTHVCVTPGRVNLLGEHTDYNDGFVLPTVIPQQTAVALAPAAAGAFVFASAGMPERICWNGSRESLPSGFAAYIAGCVLLAREAGAEIPAFELFVDSDVPMGAGLSSSAALEVAVLRVLTEWLNLSFSAEQQALMAQQAERQYAGVQCGVMDQFACRLAQAGHMLFLDTRSLQWRLAELPLGAELVVLDSGIPRKLAESGYNQRRASCEEAAERLGVKALRDVEDVSVLDRLPELLKRRARHVVTENFRVLEALRCKDALAFGRLMNDSHSSLRDDYEVSTSGLDQLVAALQAHPAVFGARLTGAGFGGACVALVQAGRAEQVAREVLETYARSGGKGRSLVPSLEQA